MFVAGNRLDVIVPGAETTEVKCVFLPSSIMHLDQSQCPITLHLVGHLVSDLNNESTTYGVKGIYHTRKVSIDVFFHFLTSGLERNVEMDRFFWSGHVPELVAWGAVVGATAVVGVVEALMA
jgi:hypothetical protein